MVQVRDENEVGFGATVDQKTWLTPEGRFTFGKFKGKSIREVSHHYLEWLARTLVEARWELLINEVVKELQRREFEIAAETQEIIDDYDQEYDYSDWLLEDE